MYAHHRSGKIKYADVPISNSLYLDDQNRNVGKEKRPEDVQKKETWETSEEYFQSRPGRICKRYLHNEPDTDPKTPQFFVMYLDPEYN